MDIVNLHEKQILIASDRHRFRVCCTGRRFGKTTLAVMEMIAKAISKPDIQVAYIAPTYQQARDIAWNFLKKQAQPAIQNVNESRLEITLKTVKGGTSTIILRGWESIETLRGQKLDFVVIDEIAMMRNWAENWQEVIRPTLTDNKGIGLFISTPKGFNHFYDLYNKERTDDDYKSFHFTTFDNSFVPKEEVEKARLEITEDRFAQEYLADFRKTEGLVYKEFNRDNHLVDDHTPKPQFIETLVGIDFGFTNPTAVLMIKKDFDNNYWVLDEWYKSKQIQTQINEAVKKFEPNIVYPDPENPQAIESLERDGVNCHEVIKGKDSIVNGISKVRDLFKQNRIKVHKRCENLIHELETYAYPDTKDERNPDEKPIKHNDHACDALRYVIMTNLPADIRAEAEDFNLYSQNYG